MEMRGIRSGRATQSARIALSSLNCSLLDYAPTSYRTYSLGPDANTAYTRRRIGGVTTTHTRVSIDARQFPALLIRSAARL